MIKEVTKQTFDIWLDLCHSLWPDYKKEELEKELMSIFNSKKEASFLYLNDDGEYIACVNISLRNDYVPGTTSKPTGYIEGIFVMEKYRNKGIAKEMIEFCDTWFLSRGCKEVASDAVVDNKTSIAFHKAIGFEEKDTLVHFVKKI